MSSNTSAQIEAKREEFRKYLEKEGVLELLTKSLVLLYEQPDRPSDALTFLREHLAGKRISELQDEVAKLKTENEELVEKVKKMEKEVAELQQQVAASADPQKPLASSLGDGSSSPSASGNISDTGSSSTLACKESLLEPKTELDSTVKPSPSASSLPVTDFSGSEMMDVDESKSKAALSVTATQMDSFEPSITDSSAFDSAI